MAPSITKTIAPGDDSDLEDLIAKPRRSRTDSAASSPLGCIGGFCSLCCYSCPRLSKCAFVLAVLGFVGYLSNTLFNPTKTMGIMGADYSAIKNHYELSLSKVDHWCIRGDNDSCKCEDPLEPTPRAEFKAWTAAHKANVADVSMYRAVYGSTPTKIDVATDKPRPPIDVAFLGESVVEAMDGRWLGKKIVRATGEKEGQEGRKPDIGKVFERFFRKEKGGPLEGVALGIAGDYSANVLWRLQHGEMPYDFNPKVWWLVLGMNDLTRMQCSEEIVVLGILRVVEEIMLRKPDALIVINSLLPMIDYRSEDVKMADVVDFRTDPDKSTKKDMEIEKAVKGFVGQKGAQSKSPDSPGGSWKYVKGEVGQENKGGRNLVMTKKRKQKWAKIDQAMEGPNLKKAMERRKKALYRHDKRLRNKKFSDNERFHPKKPLSPFIPFLKKKALPPVWPAVHLINEKIKEFADKHEMVTFFDATSIFAQDVSGGRHHLDNDLISPRGHPSELGFAVWEGRIMGRLDKMFKEMTPPPPAPADNVDDDPDERGVDDDFIEGTSYTDAKEVMDGKEDVSVGKIAVEPTEPVTLPRDNSSDVDTKKVEDDDVKEEKEEIDDDEEDKKMDRKPAKEDKKVTEELSAKESTDDEEGEKKIDSKAAKEDKKVIEDAPNEEDADDEEEEKKIDSKAAKEDKKVIEDAPNEEDADNEEDEKKIDRKEAKEDKEVTDKATEEEDDDEDVNLKAGKEEIKKLDVDDEDDEEEEE